MLIYTWCSLHGNSHCWLELFFFSSFFFARSIILDEVCFQWRVGGGRIGLSLVDFLRWENTLSGRGCHGRCDAFWKFQLNNPLSREAPWARAFDISSRYKTSRHGISKQNEIDGESMWFPTYHDHASGHKLKLVTYCEDTRLLTISTAFFDELANPGNEPRKSFVFTIDQVARRNIFHPQNMYRLQRLKWAVIQIYISECFTIIFYISESHSTYSIHIVFYFLTFSI